MNLEKYLSQKFDDFDDREEENDFDDRKEKDKFILHKEHFGFFYNEEKKLNERIKQVWEIIKQWWITNEINSQLANVLSKIKTTVDKNVDENTCDYEIQDVFYNALILIFVLSQINISDNEENNDRGRSDWEKVEINDIDKNISAYKNYIVQIKETLTQSLSEQDAEHRDAISNYFCPIYRNLKNNEKELFSNLYWDITDHSYKEKIRLIENMIEESKPITVKIWKLTQDMLKGKVWTVEQLKKIILQKKERYMYKIVDWEIKHYNVFNDKIFIEYDKKIDSFRYDPNNNKKYWNNSTTSCLIINKGAIIIVKKWNSIKVYKIT